ncbi:ABC transporter ATP-binding protein [Infirmifilum sp. NZ]|uniref:ABC transporter ATP-binding protein n=1 Tax=Infirmifilum sp. NZ TaxID=2926850 RepID=UPI0027A604F1|nr:ABC transporter ATP-binding protein [Infirmifilum sp. NZ]UNQ73679.1 ABC transporter ATP-binding protein [Infirmifilum sp. NZ]
MRSGETFIEASHLVKDYGSVRAIDGLSFDTGASVLALVGPNGAGKTTFVKIATCLLKPTSGTLRVLGLDVTSDSEELRRRISLLPQDASPDTGATPLEHVAYYLFARGYSMADARARAREVLERLGLWDHRDKQCLRLSGGMRRLVLLAMALAPDVDAVFLDEPTSGLDPVNRVRIWGEVKRMSKEGVRVLVTSHEMDEVEENSDEVVMINRGRLVARGPPGVLASEVSGLARVEVTLPGEGAYERVREALSGLTSVKGVYKVGSVAVAYVEKHAAAEAAARISEAGGGLDVKVGRCGLKDAFFRRVMQP